MCTGAPSERLRHRPAAAAQPAHHGRLQRRLRAAQAAAAGRTADDEHPVDAAQRGERAGGRGYGGPRPRARPHGRPALVQ